ncbi:hypothetical protein CAPTEDRAFT_181976 [Capitella teleta]|uniref:Cytochrome P450 n=1 Tax=Capitella teleta TaxID=283909 RepID=R7UF71_CAPTE|nr:hypothetical protein CAPTEDRAFT_181976 [Capitella teleta]|eukprot:ELU04870.1 hypothetical protein CAPTEDRAFT_181976 [Capitella teleta]
MTAKYPRSVGSWLGCLYPLVITRHPENAALLLKSSEPKPMSFGVYRYGLPWIGDGLLLSSGRKWARNRRLLTPAFHFDILKPYTKVNNEAGAIIVDKIGKAADKGVNFEVFSNVSLCTFDVILRCAMSYEDDVQIKGESHPYVQAVTELGDMWVQRALSPWLHFDFIYHLTAVGRRFKQNCEFVHSISENIIHSRRTIIADQGVEAVRKGRYLDFLDILLTAKDEDGQGLTDQEIRDEVDTFLFEGHDTTASSISWALYSFAENPDAQKKAQDEIDAVLEGRDSDFIEWDDIPKLKYLTMCIKESMRLHCPVPFIERELTKELTIDGVTLPKGSVVDIQIYNLHHNPTVWEEPMEFRPDRFLPENIDKKDSFAFVPFSAGPRNCIGQNFAMHEQKVILARILRKFHLSLDPNVKIEKKVSVVMKTQNGMPLKVEHRRG